jgi:hypothetical protein
MHGPYGLKAEVKSFFQPLIDKYNLTIQSDDLTFVKLIGAKSTILFSVDRGDLNVSFQNPEFTRHEDYGIISILDLLIEKPQPEFPKITPQSDKVLVLLEYYYTIIDKYLLHVVEGDFNWVEECRKRDDEDQYLTGYVLRELDYDNPIQKKFWSGDNTWKTDLKILLGR